jgi:hypothetical protein
VQNQLKSTEQIQNEAGRARMLGYFIPGFILKVATQGEDAASISLVEFSGSHLTYLIEWTRGARCAVQHE